MKMKLHLIDYALNQQMLPECIMEQMNEYGQITIKQMIAFNTSQERYFFVIMDGRHTMAQTLINGGNPAVYVYFGMVWRKGKYMPDIRRAVMMDLETKQTTKEQNEARVY